MHVVLAVISLTMGTAIGWLGWKGLRGLKASDCGAVGAGDQTPEPERETV